MTSSVPHWRVSLFALVLAAAGLPLYIHLPRYAAVDLGVELAAVGSLILVIRIFDFVSDPLIGYMIDRFDRHKKLLVACATGLLAAGFVMLFAIPPRFGIAIWLGMSLVLVFTGYAMGTILLYGESGAHAGSSGTQAQLRLSAWRETGTLAGVILAATAPYVLPTGFAAFGWLVAGLAILSCALTWPIWRPDHAPRQSFSPRSFLAAGGGWLLVLAMVNSLPVAITSTLFIFFVEDHLGLAGLSGPLLVLFFAGAGLSAGGWSKLASKFGSRTLLLFGMALSVASFIWAAVLVPGQAAAFAVICLMSGLALGADMVILPALFATLLARAGSPPGQGFGLWAFANKLALPVAAAVVLPALGASGFTPGTAEAPTGGLVLLYAVLPCVVKLGAGAVLLALPRHVFAGEST